MTTALDMVRWRNNLTSEYYEEVKNARKNGRPVAYVTGYLPQEILYAMDIMPVYPENYSPLLCAQGYSESYCQIMEEKGYSPELCGFSKPFIGSMYTEDGPFGGLPKPDILISSANSCGSHPLWWDMMERFFQVPHFKLDAPHTNAQPQDRHIKFYVSEMKKMIHFLEENLGVTFSDEKLRETVRLSDEANKYWIEVTEMMKNRPCPVSIRDLSGHSFAICVLAGTSKAVEFNKALRDFAAEQIKNGIGPAKKEKYRLAYDNIPIWHDMNFFKYLEEHDATVVYASFIFEIWGKRLDPDNPFESLAKKYLVAWVNRFVNSQIEKYKKTVQEYGVDGLIFFVNRGCRPYTTGQYDLARALKEEYGLPTLMIEGNMADPRGYSKSEARRMVDEFIELFD